MAVDRGGLSYTIKLRDEFTKVGANFVKTMRTAKAAFAEFKAAGQVQKANAEGFKKSTKAVDEHAGALKKLKNESDRQRAVEREATKLRSTATRDAANASKQRASTEKAAAAERQKALGAEQRAVAAFADKQARIEKETARLKKAHRQEDAKNLKDQQQSLRAFADAQTRREKDAAKIIAQKRKDEQAVRQADPAFQAQKRINQGLQEERVARSQINLLRQRAAQQFKQGDILGGSRTLKQARDLKEQLTSIDKSGNSLFFTFRRLVGVLAVFTIARSLVQGFQDLIKSGLEFNNTIDQARIGIAGLVVSSAQIRDQFGQNLEGAEAFSSAMAAADDQVKKLQKDAIKLGVSFQTLVETFQIAVAPGFGAGLNLDQIRKLTGSIAAAAKAIGLPQNQLAEEIRSLLSGTIQARTTRIATALGITNEDIKRLKQTGQLFDVLEKRFQAFNDAAERQARTTLSGVREVIGGLIQQILGQAAQPLFKELINLGNDLIDNVLRVKDATGEITLNPDLVKSFQSIFDALKDGLLEVKRIAKDLGFENLQAVFAAAGAALGAGIQFAIGFAETFLGIINRIVKVVRFVADAFGLTTKELGNVLGAIGSVVAFTVIWNNTLGLIGLSFKNIIVLIGSMLPSMTLVRQLLLGSGRAATVLGAKLKNLLTSPVALVAILALAVLGFNKISEAIFDVDLSFKETLQLLAVSFFAGLAAIGFALQELVIDFGIKIDGLLNRTIQGIVNLSTRAKKKLAELLGDTLAAGELQAELDQTQADQDSANARRKKQQELNLADLKEQNLAKIKGLEEEIAKIIGGAAGKGAQGEGFDGDKTARSLAHAAGEAQDFSGILSVIERQMQVLDELMQQVDADTLTAGAAFRAAFEAPDLEGIGKDIQDIFSGRDIKLATDLNKIRDTALTVETKIAEIQAQQQISSKRRGLLELAASGQLNERQIRQLKISKAEGLIVSLLQDRKIIAEDLATIEQKTLDLARAEAAIKAVAGTRELTKEAVLLRQSLAIGQQITAADAIRLDLRKRAVLEAQFALDTEKTAQQETEAAAERTLKKLREQQAILKSGPQTPDSRAENAQIDALIIALQQQLDLNKAISAERQKQLELVKAEAELVANGSITQGLSRGFEDVVKDLPTAFEAGVTIVKQSVTALADFISSSIVQAFDPTDDTSLQEKFARFLQGIAQLILQQLTQLGIAAAIQALTQQASAATIEQTSAVTATGIRVAGATTAANIEIAGAVTAAAIRAASGGGFGLHTGGLVPAYHEGGHIARGRRTASKAHAIAEGYARGGRNRHPLDTVPAWLQPGEFVIPKSIVDDLGLDLFENIRRGRFPVAAAAPPSGAHAAIPGMARGGLVSDQAQRQSVGASRSGDVQILPTLVAGEKELDRLHAGGRSAFIKTIRDNAPTIRGILQGGR